MKIVELTMIKFRRMIGSIKEQIKDGSIVVRIVEGKAGPPPKDKTGWAREKEIIGYIVSPRAFEDLKAVSDTVQSLRSLADEIITAPDDLKEDIIQQL